MLSIAHGTTGALIAQKIPNPLISIPLIIASHFIEDRIPHWDVGQGLGKKTKTKRDAFLQELFIDFPLSIIVVFLFFQLGHPFDWRVWMGWFMGLFPDFLEFPFLFLNQRFTPIRQIAKFHEYVHRSTPDKVKGLLPQFLVIIAVYLLR